MVLDTNILIYAAKPGGEHLRPWIQHPEAMVSILTRIEALGFPKITPEEKAALEEAFACLPESGLTEAIAGRAIDLRQEGKIGLADAVIAATALHYATQLVTRNVADFEGVTDLAVINPFDRATER